MLDLGIGSGSSSAMGASRELHRSASTTSASDSPRTVAARTTKHRRAMSQGAGVHFAASSSYAARREGSTGERGFAPPSSWREEEEEGETAALVSPTPRSPLSARHYSTPAAHMRGSGPTTGSPTVSGAGGSAATTAGGSSSHHTRSASVSVSKVTSSISRLVSSAFGRESSTSSSAAATPNNNEGLDMIPESQQQQTGAWRAASPSLGPVSPSAASTATARKAASASGDLYFDQDKTRPRSWGVTGKGAPPGMEMGMGTPPTAASQKAGLSQMFSPQLMAELENKLESSNNKAGVGDAAGTQAKDEGDSSASASTAAAAKATLSPDVARVKVRGHRRSRSAL